MRITLKAIALGLLIVTLALPASATKPVSFDAGVTHEGEVNPCTGETHDVTIVWQIDLIANKKSEVLVLKSTITTSDGWSGFGRESQVITPNAKLIGGFSMQVRQDDGHGMFMVKARRTIDLSTGEVTTESFEAECVRN